MEDFVTFEIAKKLRENGFRELCTHCYINGTFRPQEMFRGLRSNTHHKWSFNSIMVQLKDTHERVQVNIVDAPTISQVLKWLREEKKYHIEFVGNACGYLFIISDVPSEGGTDRYCSDYSGPNDGGTWDKYEDCALVAIEYVLDNLI